MPVGMIASVTDSVCPFRSGSRLCLPWAGIFYFCHQICRRNAGFNQKKIIKLWTGKCIDMHSL